MLKGKTIVLGVTGGIAVYKAADLVSRLKKQGAKVDVIMTEAATKFVAPLTFQTLALSPVYIDMFAEPKNYDVEHISLAERADLFLIAPATANTIGKIANGIADNLLTTTVMATKAPVLIAPAMNTNMYLNPITQKNISYLKELGYKFIDPRVGMLACQTSGLGRMEEPENIVKRVIEEFRSKDLGNKKVVVTAGPTIEPLDPVRYLTNHSSGKMGYSIAEEAAKRGAETILISGPTNLSVPNNVKLIQINTTNEMFKAVEEHFNSCDVLIKAAAPSDYRPEHISREKIKKDSNIDKLTVDFVRNPDIVAHFGKIKGDRIVVGFAAETNNLLEHGKEKLKKKNLDFIVANNVVEKGAGFKGDTNIVTIIEDEDRFTEYPLLGKSQVAKIILDKVVNLLDAKAR